MKYLSLLCCMCMLTWSEGAYAQFFVLTHLTGTQNVGGTNVTVTPAALGTNTVYYCGEGPYWVGAYDIPGTYTYNFSNPVSAVRVRLTAMNTGEVVSFQ